MQVKTVNTVASVKCLSSFSFPSSSLIWIALSISINDESSDLHNKQTVFDYQILSKQTCKCTL